MADEDGAVHAGTGAQSVETGVVRLYSVVVIVGGCAWAALDSLVSTVFPPLLWARSRGVRPPAGPFLCLTASILLYLPTFVYEYAIMFS
jgi:hypothetical protein